MQTFKMEGIIFMLADFLTFFWTICVPICNARMCFITYIKEDRYLLIFLLLLLFHSLTHSHTHPHTIILEALRTLVVYMDFVCFSCLIDQLCMYYLDKGV